MNATPPRPAASSPSPAVELRGVTFAYGRRKVLEDVDLRVEEGEFLGIIGPNGAGKTTLLRLVLGLLEPTAGEVRVLGTSPRDARGRVGYVPQYARFDPEFPVSVRELVTMGRLGRAGGRRSRDGAESLKAAVGRMELKGLMDEPIGELSGGQLQRALIARALAVGPELLLLDEPAASLDTRLGRTVYEHLAALTGEMTVVLVSHDIGVISRHVSHVACLNRRLHYHGTEELTPEMIERTYGTPVDLVAHGHGGRLLEGHRPEPGEAEGGGG